MGKQGARHLIAAAKIAVPRAVRGVIGRAIPPRGGAGIIDSTPVTMLWVGHHSMRVFEGPDGANLRTLAPAELARTPLVELPSSICDWMLQVAPCRAGRGRRCHPDPVQRLDLADLADGAARLELGRQGVVDEPVAAVDLDGADWSLSPRVVAVLAAQRSRVLVGVARSPLPPVAREVMEALAFTVAPEGPGRSWIDSGSTNDAVLERVGSVVATAPLAALMLLDVLDVTSTCSVEHGLVVESLAYSTLLAGPEFGHWRMTTPRREVPTGDDPVLMTRDGAVLRVVLNRPARHNAFGHEVRNGLLGALEVARLDNSVARVELSGAGPSFCSGGDLDEFGTTPDVATAHGVRLAASAGMAVHRLRDVVRPELHGACIGAGIEVPSFAERVRARPGTSFALPETGFGLVPGAGGTVSLTRRIGRWRTAWLALTGHRLDLDRALAWGLVDDLA